MNKLVRNIPAGMEELNVLELMDVKGGISGGDIRCEGVSAITISCDTFAIKILPPPID